MYKGTRVSDSSGKLGGDGSTPCTFGQDVDVALRGSTMVFAPSGSRLFFERESPESTGTATPVVADPAQPVLEVHPFGTGPWLLSLQHGSRISDVPAHAAARTECPTSSTPGLDPSESSYAALSASLAAPAPAPTSVTENFCYRVPVILGEGGCCKPVRRYVDLHLRSRPVYWHRHRKLVKEVFDRRVTDIIYQIR
eukprot:Rmarinus@m.8661